MYTFSATRGWRHVSAFNTRRVIPTRRLVEPRVMFSGASVANMGRWNVGDVVRLKDGTATVGTIEEVRGSGWYTVKKLSQQRIDEEPIRVRGTQLIAASLGDDAAASANTSPSSTRSLSSHSDSLPDGTVPQPPTIYDLDALLQDPPFNYTDASFMVQLKHFSTFQHWVVLTDLHCAPSTLETCLKVLDKTHALARDRNAGILFLGDFWHHRGTLRVDCLNAVLVALKTWTVPMIMIPGNHDQITLRGHEHGLTPLENAYRLMTDITSGDAADTSVPGILIFSHPTKFHNAFFIPHIRDAAMMESILQSPQALSSSALFVHADVTGAFMNDMVQSSGGVPPRMFPVGKCIYSGHFHKPHVVATGSGRSIEYLGSPYQVSLSEAHQDKALAVMSVGDGWKCTEKIPMDIGRRHFRLFGIEQLMELSLLDDSLTAVEHKPTVRPGDRVVCSMSKGEMKQLHEAANDYIHRLRKAGVSVEIREVTEQLLMTNRENIGGDYLSAMEDMSPKATLKAYLDHEVERGAMMGEHAKAMLAAGLQLLDTLTEENEELRVESGQHRAELVVDSVTVEGFGPFRTKQTYPLRDRGLVLLRGNNQDGGADSNGSGKSLLAMSTLWCFTGSLDARPMDDAKVSDIVNDDCKTARVTVQGELNGVDFSITRSKTSTKSGLIFLFGGNDLSAQSAKDTQALVEEKLGVDARILARTVFHGQHSIDDLLEASDTKLKDELSMLVPLSVWQEATAKARKLARVAVKKCDEIRGMLSVRKSDLVRMNSKVNAMKSDVALKEQEHTVILQAVSDEIALAEQSVTVDLDRLAANSQEASVAIRELELEAKPISVQRQADLERLRSDLSEKETTRASLDEQFRVLQGHREILALKLESATDRLQSLETTWKVNLSQGDLNLQMPEACPTCGQTMTDCHIHDNLEETVTAEVKAALASLAQAKTDLAVANTKHDACEQSLLKAAAAVKSTQSKLDEREAHWSLLLAKCDENLNGARRAYEDASKTFASAAMQVKNSARVDELNARADRSHTMLQVAKESLAAVVTESEEYERMVDDFNDEIARQQRIESSMADLSNALSPRGVQTFVLQNSITSLQDAAQSYLNDLSDGSQRIELKLDMGDRISRRAFVRDADGGYRERALASLSGGQWRRCSLALNLGFSDLVSRRGQLRSSLFVLDEPLTHLDRTGRSNVGHVLRDLLRRHAEGASQSLSVSTIILILQDLTAEELEESFDCIDEVVKRDGSSRVVVDEDL